MLNIVTSYSLIYAAITYAAILLVQQIHRARRPQLAFSMVKRNLNP